MKRVLFIILFFNISLYIFPQYYTNVFTPTGNPVQAEFGYQEFNSNQIIQLNRQYTQAFPQALFIANASNKYNNHAFVWHIWEGGAECWIHQLKNDNITPNLSIYWTNNGGYRETTESRAEKIYYYASDHSAVPSTDISGWYESKWDLGPRMCHAPEYGPYTNMDKREYFERSIVPNPAIPTVEDGMIICSNGDGPVWLNQAFNYYSPVNWPSNYTFEWQVMTSKDVDIIGTKATISNQTVNSAVITFTQIGLYNIYLTVWNTNGEIVGTHCYEAAVEVYSY